MNNYIAWLNGQSVARGTLSEVERKAREIAAIPAFQEFGFRNGEVELRITRGPRQLFAKAIILRQDGKQ